MSTSNYDVSCLCVCVHACALEKMLCLHDGGITRNENKYPKFMATDFPPIRFSSLSLPFNLTSLIICIVLSGDRPHSSLGGPTVSQQPLHLPLTRGEARGAN